MPRAFATQRGEERRFLGRPQFQPLPDFGVDGAPLLPEAPAQAAPQPGSEVGQRAVVLGAPTVLYPASNLLIELGDPVGHGDAPASPGQLAQPRAKGLKRRGGPRDACPVEGKAQEPAFSGWPDRTLGLIDLPLQVVLEKPSETGFGPLARPSAFDSDEEVSTVGGEVLPAPLQFLIQVI
jgi:hypothetical protein